MCSLGENPRFFCVHLGMSERTWWCNKVFRGWTKMERDGVYNGQISSLRWNTASGILSLEFSLSCRHKKSMVSNFVQESTFRWRQTATCCTSGGEWLCMSDKNLSERWWKPLNSKLHLRTWSVCEVCVYFTQVHWFCISLCCRACTLQKLLVASG